jgi:hypothetical protein
MNMPQSYVIRTLSVLFTINNIVAAVISVPLKLGTKKINDGTVMQVQFLLNSEDGTL